MSVTKFDQSDPMDVALLDVRNYANDQHLSADQVKDCFLAGARASQILGGGKHVPSTGWQSRYQVDHGRVVDTQLEARIAKFDADLARAAEVYERRAAEIRKSLAEIEAALSVG